MSYRDYLQRPATDYDEAVRALLPIIQQDANTTGMTSSLGLTQQVWDSVVAVVNPSNLPFRRIIPRNGMKSESTDYAKQRQIWRDHIGGRRKGSATAADTGGRKGKVQEYNLAFAYQKLSQGDIVQLDSIRGGRTLTLDQKATKKILTYTELIIDETWYEIGGQPFAILGSTAPATPVGTAKSWNGNGPIGANYGPATNTDGGNNENNGVGEVSAGTYYIRVACKPHVGVKFSDPKNLDGDGVVTRSSKQSASSNGVVIASPDNAIEYRINCTTRACRAHDVYVTDGTTGGSATADFTYVQTDWGMVGTIYKIPTADFSSHVGAYQPPTTDTSANSLEMAGFIATTAASYDTTTGAPVAYLASGSRPSGATIRSLNGLPLQFSGGKSPVLNQFLSEQYATYQHKIDHALIGPKTFMYVSDQIYQSSGVRLTYTPTEAGMKGQAGLVFDAYQHPTQGEPITFIVDPQAPEGSIEFFSLTPPPDTQGMSSTMEMRVRDEYSDWEYIPPVDSTSGNGKRWGFELDGWMTFANWAPQLSLAVRGIDFRQ